MTRQDRDLPAAALHRLAHARRIERVVAYIDDHLAQALRLEQLAAVAHSSPFHFHRVFSAWTGETVADHVRRKRLERAALRLVLNPRLDNLSVAIEVGFGSAEAFCRAFRAHFGCPPQAWRLAFRRRQSAATIQSNPDQSLSKIGQGARRSPGQDGRSSPTSTEHPMRVEFTDRAPVRLACRVYVGPHGPALGRFWLEQVGPWLVAHGLDRQPRFGISLDHPEITPADRCRYAAGVALPEGRPVPGDAVVRELGGGQHAEGLFRGTAVEIGAAWDWLLGEWLPTSGLQLRAKPFEYYAPDAEFDPVSGAFSCRIVLPVRAATAP